MDYALALAIIMCVLEVVLGFALIFGSKIKVTLISLFTLTVVFFFLTLHTWQCDPFATYNEIRVVPIGSEQEQLLNSRAEESGASVEFVGKDAQNATFKEKMAVQCVNDCGCFGDAMKGSLGRSLTPYESFLKDVILMILLIPVALYAKKIKENDTAANIGFLLGSLVVVGFLSWVFNWKFYWIFFVVGFVLTFVVRKFLKSEWTTYIVITILTLLFIRHTYNHLPMRDYRPYAVGNNISELMQLPEGAQPDVYENIFYYKNLSSGEVEEHNANSEMLKSGQLSDKSKYEFVDRKTKLITAGDKPLISDFNLIYSDGNDYTEDILNEEYVILVIAYDIEKSDKAVFSKLNELQIEANNNGMYIYGVSASSESDVSEFRHDHEVQSEIEDWYSADGTTLKTVIRSNPGIVLFKKGVVLGKWHFNDCPSFQEISKLKS
ncbi:MAG: hypothetical protein MRY83_19235 [Flavobacteriales bacterium]|nr:hypothetical protein [Flavobacteriales bacterium]